MKRLVGIVVFAGGAAMALGAPGHAQSPSYPAGFAPPAWAYGFATVVPPGPPPPPAPPAAGRGAGRGAQQPDETLRSVPGSTLQFTRAQIANAFGPADWFPQDHPTMPEIVAKGRMPDARACSLCHYPNGKGRPENAGPAGLNPVYITQQLLDFKNDKRASADYRKNNTNIMTQIAKAMTDAEIKESAEYFAKITFDKPWITVKESETVPTTRIQGGMFLALDPPGSEPLGNRIIEMPENTEATEILRNPRSGFIAYAPIGSLKKGLQLAMSGVNGKTTSCMVCHGEDLKGIGPVPGIAGRSPSYIVRQLYDIKAGTRKGAWIDLMKPVADKMTEDDMLNIAAFAASRMP
jgi:cytochrome c553